MRLAVISDIHGNLAALEAVLADIKARGADRTINLGDCVTSPLWPRETFEALQPLSLPTVRGNHDRWIEEFPDDRLAGWSVCAQRIDCGAASRTPQPPLPNTAGRRDPGLPRHARRRYDLPVGRSARGRPLRAGASRRADRASFERANGARGRCGHSHRQAAVQGPGDCLVLNPGSVGCPVFADIPFAANLEHRSPHARYAILTKRPRGWQIELLALEYDWEAASAQALANGRPDWAQAMLSGHVK